MPASRKRVQSDRSNRSLFGVRGLAGYDTALTPELLEYRERSGVLKISDLRSGKVAEIPGSNPGEPIMESVYIFGPIHIHGDDYRQVYENLMDLASEYFDDRLGTYPDFWNTDEKPREFYNRTKENITKCDLFVAEVTAPSHGVGMELEMAVKNEIPVIALAKEGEDISSMVKGLPELIKVVRYEDSSDLEEKLEEEFQELSKEDN